MTKPSAPPNYWDYLQIDALLSLQGGLDGDDDALVADELLFIVVHQAYELWFKMVIREMREAIGGLGSSSVPEEAVPHVVHHLKRAGQVVRLAVEQFHIMETLTPQDFLGFRDKLVPASGFQSFQMRVLEILLGLTQDQREQYGKTDALEHIRGLAENSPGGARAWSEISRARTQAADGFTLRAALHSWLERTPIDGSSPGDPDDDATVGRFLAEYEAALVAYHQQQATHLGAAGIARQEDIDARFAASTAGAIAYLQATDTPAGPERKRIRRIRAGLLYIESHRTLPLLAWPRLLVDTVVELEEQFVLFRSRHARMVERIIGRRIGTGGSSGVDYLDRTTKARVFTELWTVRTLLLPKDRVPPVRNGHVYKFAVPAPPAGG